MPFRQSAVACLDSLVSLPSRIVLVGGQGGAGGTFPIFTQWEHLQVHFLAIEFTQMVKVNALIVTEKSTIYKPDSDI